MEVSPRSGNPQDLVGKSPFGEFPGKTKRNLDSSYVQVTRERLDWASSPAPPKKNKHHNIQSYIYKTSKWGNLTKKHLISNSICGMFEGSRNNGCSPKGNNSSKANVSKTPKSPQTSLSLPPNIAKVRTCLAAELSSFKFLYLPG